MRFLYQFESHRQQNILMNISMRPGETCLENYNTIVQLKYFIGCVTIGHVSSKSSDRMVTNLRAFTGSSASQACCFCGHQLISSWTFGQMEHKPIGKDPLFLENTNCRMIGSKLKPFFSNSSKLTRHAC